MNDTCPQCEGILERETNTIDYAEDITYKFCPFCRYETTEGHHTMTVAEQRREALQKAFENVRQAFFGIPDGPDDLEELTAIVDCMAAINRAQAVNQSNN